MLIVRLFAVSAGLMAFFAFGGRWQILRHISLRLRIGHFSFAPFYWQLFGALICGVFALAYFGVTRLTQQLPNQIIGLLSFSMIAAPLVVWLTSAFRTAANGAPSYWLTLVLVASILIFLLGSMLSLVNLASMLAHR